MGLFDRFKKTAQERLLAYLNNKITDTSCLEDIINAFEEMCSIPVKNDMILFETGTYSFTGEQMFYFSLVRQFPNDEEEYYQIRVDVLYVPSVENSYFQQSIWNEDIDGNIFNYVKESQEFVFCKDKEIFKVEIYLDET